MKEDGERFMRKGEHRIDIKKMDEQLTEFIDRAWSINKNVKMEGEKVKEDWEIDPCKLTVKETIAKGSFASVHKGTYDGQDVAVKVLDWGEKRQRRTGEIASIRKAFRQEVCIWHNLTHPNVTKLIGGTMEGMSSNKVKLEVQSDRQSCCVVIEYLPGGTLKSYLKRNCLRKLPFNIVIQFALDIANGLRYLHSRKIVHRDVKPENMLLDKNRRIKITDFGVARFESLNSNEMTGCTGTPGYMAPEVLENRPYNRKCDVYSFGICLWEIYCRDIPYRSLTLYELTSSVVYQNLRPEIPKCCPSSLAQVMKKCWHGDPRKRPDMEEVVSMLENIDTSKGRSMVHDGQRQGCFCFLARRF